VGDPVGALTVTHVTRIYIYLIRPPYQPVSYHEKRTGSGSIPVVKLLRAELVVQWVTVCEAASGLLFAQQIIVFVRHHFAHTQPQRRAHQSSCFSTPSFLMNKWHHCWFVVAAYVTDGTGLEGSDLVFDTEYRREGSIELWRTSGVSKQVCIEELVN
jgi:hypothetical protein